MNGLNISSHQARHVIAAAREADEAKGAPRERTVEELRAEVAALRDVLAALRSGQEPDGAAKRRLAEIEARGREGPGGRKSPRKVRGREELAGEVLGVLSPAQVKVLEDYDACLIPPKNLKDPVRVGQASDTSHGEKILEKMRKIPADRYEKLREAIAENHLRAIQERQGTFNATEEPAMRALWHRVVDKARGLDEVAFELEKSALARELEPLAREKVLKDRIEELAGGPAVKARRNVATFLCDPRIAPLLEERLARLEKEEREGQVNLDTIRPADGCRDGRCAIRD